MLKKYKIFISHHSTTNPLIKFTSTLTAKTFCFTHHSQKTLTLMRRCMLSLFFSKNKYLSNPYSLHYCSSTVCVCVERRGKKWKICEKYYLFFNPPGVFSQHLGWAFSFTHCLIPISIVHHLDFLIPPT